MPTGLVKVHYSVQLDDVSSHNVQLTISRLKSSGIWGALYYLSMYIKCFFYYGVYIIIGIAHKFT